eukprot:787777_1
MSRDTGMASPFQVCASQRPTAKGVLQVTTTNAPAPGSYYASYKITDQPASALRENSPQKVYVPGITPSVTDRKVTIVVAGLVPAQLYNFAIAKDREMKDAVTAFGSVQHTTDAQGKIKLTSTPLEPRAYFAGFKPLTGNIPWRVIPVTVKPAPIKSRTLLEKVSVAALIFIIIALILCAVDRFIMHGKYFKQFMALTGCGAVATVTNKSISGAGVSPSDLVSDSGLDVGIIIMIVLGCVVLVVGIGAAVVYFLMKRNVIRSDLVTDFVARIKNARGNRASHSDRTAYRAGHVDLDSISVSTGPDYPSAMSSV